ncbi:xanthine dehydrogenase family protein molybdopterin-binding subunit [Acidianus sulfidivorans]|nr:xanthine dehydrogenase family protein molybdopterin-binding subunit [Acidianus sulfidivorans]
MYIEGIRAVNGEGEYISDLPDLPGTLYMAIYRSPIPHGILKKVDLEEVRSHGGIGIGPEDMAKIIVNPFPSTVDAPIKYYPFAKGKLRFVGEPIAIVLANDPYKAIDLLDYVSIDYEELPPVKSIDDALKGKALVHDELKSNIAMKRNMKFGNLPSSDLLVSEDFKFPRHSAMPLEPYGLLVRMNEELEVWANVQGPMLQVYFLSKALNIPISNIKLYSPKDIGGSFGSKYSLYPYITLAASASKLTKRPIRWTETRTENFLASSAGGERRGSVQIMANKDGKITGIIYNFYEDVGAYVRPPEPGALFRVQGNLNGAYNIQYIEANYTVVLTNKSPTGLNRGYGGPPFYFALETAVDKLADELGIDPLEIRLKNLIKLEDFKDGFYHTVSGGLYPRQDYERVVNAIKDEYYYWKEESKKRKNLGVGLAVLVEPSGTNLGYVDLALENRKNPHSSSGDYATISVNPDGSISVFINGTNEGLGHETTIVEYVSKELGIEESMVKVENKVDTTKPWNLASGSYSSRFAPIVMSAVAKGVKELKENLKKLAMKYLESENVEFEKGVFYDVNDRKKSVSIRKLASAFHWNPNLFGDSISLVVTSYFYPDELKPAEGDKINSSLGYSIQAHLAVVEVDPITEEIKVKRYVISHDAGKILNRELAESQLYGGLMHGIDIALYEELKYDKGIPQTLTFDSYESPTLSEAIGMEVKFIHFETNSPFLPSGAYGLGEGPIMGAPAAISNAVSRMGKRITELPIRW